MTPTTGARDSGRLCLREVACVKEKIIFIKNEKPD